MAWYMTLYKGGDYSVFETMPVKILKDLTDWRMKYEQDKREMTEKEIEEHKNSTKINARSRSKPKLAK